MRSKPPIIATIRAEAGRRVGGGDALVEEAVSGADYSCTGVVSGAAVVSEAGVGEVSGAGKPASFEIILSASVCPIPSKWISLVVRWCRSAAG